MNPVPPLARPGYDTMPGRFNVFIGDFDECIQWTRNGQPIPGATECTYVTTLDDIGYTIYKVSWLMPKNKTDTYTLRECVRGGWEVRSIATDTQLMWSPDAEDAKHCCDYWNDAAAKVNACQQS